MKVLKYYLCTKVNTGTTEDPYFVDALSPVVMDWNEVNEETAKKESYNGEYTIEDDGRPDLVAEPTADDIINSMLGVNRYA